MCEKTQKTLVLESFFSKSSGMDALTQETCLRVPVGCMRVCILMVSWNPEHSHLELNHICLTVLHPEAENPFVHGNQLHR